MDGLPEITANPKSPDKRISSKNPKDKTNDEHLIFINGIFEKSETYNNNMLRGLICNHFDIGDHLARKYVAYYNDIDMIKNVGSASKNEWKKTKTHENLQHI